MYLNLAIVFTVLTTALLLWLPRLHGSVTWRAMITPLASIIGSGFLVLGPILDSEYGMYAPLVMGCLCVGAYLFGSAIRYNMAALDSSTADATGLVSKLESAASWSLGCAYIISVAYYLNLLGSFGVSFADFKDPFEARLLTSAVFIIILYVGWTRGFRSLEHMEYVSVTAKLAIIAGLLVGLAVYFCGTIQSNGLIFNAPQRTGLSAIALAFGLIVTVQGFETSRYLGAEYDSRTRIRSMQWSQWLSSAIYMVYILLMAYVFEKGELRLTETAIVDMMSIVAPILPVLLVAAALAAQFSAAVADTSGSGGLIAEMSANRLTPRMAYALLTGIGLLLTWFSDVFQIISYASRAFALYYTLQAAIAAVTSWRQTQRWRSLGFSLLTLVGVLIICFGQAVEV